MSDVQKDLTRADPASHTSAPQAPVGSTAIPWYRRGGWVTAMVGGVLLVGPLLAPVVLLIVATGPVYARQRSGELRKWDASTRGLVAFFALLVTFVWLYEVFGNRLGSRFSLP
jgi:hypothetical protein